MAKFEQGQSGNPSGRPIGALNKVNEKLRCFISDFLEENYDEVKAEFATLKGKDKIKVWCELLQYALPRLQAQSTSLNFEDLSDEQLDYIISKLKGEA